MAGRPTLGSIYAGEGSLLRQHETHSQINGLVLAYHIGDKPVWLISNRVSSIGVDA